MSYPPPNNYGQYSQGPPPQGYPAAYPPASYPARPQQPPYGAPPPGGSPAPPASAGYPPHSAAHQQPQYQGAPYQQYPAHPQQFQQPPAGYGQPPWGSAPPPAQYGTPPPPHGAPGSHSPYPPQAGGQYPPPGQYPPQGHFPPSGPPPGAYGGPPPGPPGPYGAAPGGYPPPAAPVPAPPSLGYDPDQRASGDASKEADALRKAMKGWGTDEAALISVLAKPDPLQMTLIRNTYMERHGRSLEKDLKSELSGDFEIAMLSLAAGPLGQDIMYLRDAMSGIGTDETAINDVLIGRSNADLRAIKYQYVHKYNKALVEDIKSDLSGKTEKFFLMLLNAVRPERGTYFDQAAVEKDVHELHLATNAKTGTDEIGVAAVFLGASDQKLVATAQAFEAKYHISLEKTIKSEFSGHLEKALLALLARAKDPLKFDVETMLAIVPVGGANPDMKRLIYWAVRLHWNPPYLKQVKEALTQRTGSDFSRRIRAAIPPGDLQNVIMKVWS